MSIIGAGLFSKEMVNIWHEYKVRTCNFMTYKYMHVHYNSIVLTDLRIKLLVHILLQRVSFLLWTAKLQKFLEKTFAAQNYVFKNAIYIYCNTCKYIRIVQNIWGSIHGACSNCCSFNYEFSATFMLQATGRAAERGGATGPHSAHGSQKDQYALIEQSNAVLKQSLHIFALGPSSSLGCPGHRTAKIRKFLKVPWILMRQSNCESFDSWMLCTIRYCQKYARKTFAFIAKNLQKFCNA